ncbi:MAG: Fic family protein, partial [Lachnospiraceae bacterium]|nr:Fic family protein [Lachnospiraceae bacterium]
FYDNIHAIYTEGLAQLETKINLALASQNTISVDGFINGMFSDMEKQAYEYLKTLPENDKRKDTFMGEVAMNFGGRDIQKFYGKEGEDWGIADQDLPEAFTNTTAPFKLATETMEGVADIGTYDPNSMSVKLLFSGRSGNSTTLGRSVEELSQEREQILNDDKLNERQKEERVKILDRRIIETRNAVYGMNAGAEIARIHSSQMMAKKDPITFSDLYNAFSELNQALRPADPEGGTLRAHYVHAGAIKGVHGSFVPSTLIKTLDMIADGMNQIKATEDVNLRKTRAIQLSSFAYTMMVSEHVFGDGNSRTCRLFADTILQTFGLPPYIPVNDKEIKIHTLGKSMDFNKAADVFLKGVKASDNILKPQIQAINDAKEAEARRGRDGMESLVRNINENVRYFNEAYANTKPAEADNYAANLSSQIQAERRFNYFMDAIFNPVAGLSNEDCMAVMSDQDKDTIQRQMVFVAIRRIQQRAVKPDGTKYPIGGDGSIQNLPYEEQKKLYDQYITNEEKSGLQRDAVKNMLSKNPQRLETFIGDLSGRMGPRMGAFYDFVRNAPGVEKELSHQEKRVYSRNGRIEELRNQIRSNTAYTDAQKEQYLAALNNAEELTASGKQELCAKGDVIEKAYRKINIAREKKSIAARDERFKDSDGIARRPRFMGEGGAEGLLPERENRLRGVYDTGAPLTYEYKQTIVRMLQKMRDMEVLPKDDIYAGRVENPTKDYAFRNLLNARSDYKDAIDNGDIDKLPELRERYDKEYQNIKELMDMAHEGLGDKPYNMPGNLNGHRHDLLFPYELLEDVTAQSQVNGVYQIYLAMHRLNMDDAQEFMDNFGENMVRAEAVRGEKYSLKNCLKGKNDMDSLLDVIAGDEADKNFAGYEFMLGVNRWPDSLGNMAPDGEDFDAITEYSDNVMAAMDDVKARYLSKFKILTANYDEFRDQPGYDVIMQARKNTLENLITVDDLDRDPDQIIGVQGANPDGTLKEVFDINAYAASHQPDLSAMKQRVDKMLQKFGEIQSKGAVKKADVLQAAARSYARLLKVHAIESGSQWYQDLKQMSVELMNTMEKDPAVAAEDKAVLNAAVRKNHMSPKEAQFLLNEMTYMLTEDEGIRNEWKNLYEQKPEKADMVLNNNKIDQNGKENFLDYANLFAERSEKPFEEANKEHNTIRDSSKVTWAGHKANNIKDPLTLITTFFELPQETQDRMPQLKEYMKKRAPLMEFLVNANTATDFEAHTSLNRGLAYGYNTKRNGEFDKGILYNSNDGVRNRSDGLGRCDTLKEIPDGEKEENNGRYYLSNIEKAAGLTNEAAKEVSVKYSSVRK